MLSWLRIFSALSSLVISAMFLWKCSLRWTHCKNNWIALNTRLHKLSGLLIARYCRLNACVLRADGELRTATSSLTSHGRTVLFHFVFRCHDCAWMTHPSTSWLSEARWTKRQDLTSIENRMGRNRRATARSHARVCVYGHRDSREASTKQKHLPYVFASFSQYFRRLRNYLSLWCHGLEV